MQLRPILISLTSKKKETNVICTDVPIGQSDLDIHTNNSSSILKRDSFGISGLHFWLRMPPKHNTQG